MSGREGKEEMTYDSLLWEETKQQQQQQRVYL